ncbi:MAG: hypothetical protein K0R54_477 [Clostridiaceae bacterium]|jgi:hypothetical protein|nr:hypothetical protein [Clostridiaceae bacterium]
MHIILLILFLGGLNIMKTKDHREYTKNAYLENGTKTQSPWSKNKFNTTIKEPGTNESGIEARKKGW